MRSVWSAPNFALLLRLDPTIHRVARRDTMTPKSICALIGSLILLVQVGCSSLPEVHTVPITGRKTILQYPEPEEITMGLSAYEQLTAKVPASQNPQYIEMVNRVGQRIAEVADRPDYAWEFRVLATSEQNAFCLPGGKVAIHEGILPICESEAGLAVVMAHEVAHALARHGGERMTHQQATETAKNFLGQFMQQQEPLTQELVLQAYGLGTKYGILLPYSRKHESEADHMGLVLMARAGYDPAEAPRFWQRFATMKQGGQQPEFLSTHPGDERRAADLLELLPEAQQEFLAAKNQFGRGEMIAFSPLPRDGAGQHFATPTTSIATSPIGSGVRANTTTLPLHPLPQPVPAQRTSVSRVVTPLTVPPDAPPSRSFPRR